MTHQPMLNTAKRVFIAISLFSCLVSSLPAIASSGFGYDEKAGGGSNCAIDETPLSICQYYRQFKKADARLNREYKRLYKMLDSRNAHMLKQSQKLWIDWRDAHSGAVYEKTVFCAGTVCIDAVHDNCVIDLTEKRAEELLQFQKNLPLAIEKAFSFSQDHECRLMWGPRQ